MTEGKYRGRFAPSPTGPLHFGSLVAAVGSFLEARTRGGEWLVRMEDLDPLRVAPGAADGILRTLAAYGLDCDGPVAYQSARNDAYHAALHRLRELHLVYPCACSRREIADSAIAGREGPVYPGTCREGFAAGKAARSLRLDTRGAAAAFEDAIQGQIVCELERESGDFVLYRADGAYAYQLAVVVDDAEQGITDVVRGADFLASTPRQIYLQQLLGLPRPRYVHLPIAVNARGEKLSKQTLALPLDRTSPLPALIAALAFLGQQPPHELARETVRAFWKWAVENWKLDRVPRVATAPAGFSGSQ
ncbi:MAG: tRNA glutamyl-Q(34) synthetase GluQRS [Burkholderiales bacterium]